MLAFEEAERLYDRSPWPRSSTAAPTDAAQRRLLLALGDVQVKLGSTRCRAARRTRAARAGPRRATTPTRSAARRARARRRRLMAGGVVDESDRRQSSRRRSSGCPATDSALRARLLGRLAMSSSFSDAARALRRAQRAGGRRRAPGRRRAAPTASRSSRATGACGDRRTSRPARRGTRAARPRRAHGRARRSPSRAIAGACSTCSSSGDIAAVDAEIDAYARLADERRLASEQWYVPLFRRHADAARRTPGGRRARRRRGAAPRPRGSSRPTPSRPTPCSWSRCGASRAGSTEIEPAVRACAERYRGDPRLALRARVPLRGDRAAPERAAEELDALAAGGFGAIPHDGIWLGALGAPRRDVRGARRARRTPPSLVRRCSSRTATATW